MEPIKITITGELGSGKSSVGKTLSAEMNIQFLSTGQIQRKIAAEMEMSTLELNLLAEKDPAIDKKIDQYTTDLEHQNTPYVVDSRMGWHFMPSSFKVYLLTDLKIAAQRINKDTGREQSESYKNVAAAIRELTERRQSERRRFKTKYGVDLWDMNNFDLVVDTSHITVEEACELIKKHYQKKKDGVDYVRLWVDPKRLLPTKRERSYENDSIMQVLGMDDTIHIYSGHQICSEALQKNVHILPAKIISGVANSEFDEPTKVREYVLSNTEKETLSMWEEKHHFVYSLYPSFLVK